MKYTIELDTFQELVQRLEKDRVSEAFCRGRMKATEKGEYIPYVEITATMRIGQEDTLFYIFQEMISTPVNFNRLEHETDDALMKRKNDFTANWMRTLDETYIRGLQGVKGLRVWMGAISVVA
jgi:hypothetical protein